MRNRYLLLAAATAIAVSTGTDAAERKVMTEAEAAAVTPSPDVKVPVKDVRDDADIVLASATEYTHSTRSSITLDGKVVNYTATPGRLTIRNDDGEAMASVFYVAYVADRPAGAPERPVTFTYNGGPGSSSMWLHMGSIGPVHVETPNPSATPGGPFRIVDNPHSVLDKTDIVFIDAIGPGLSRPIGKFKGPEFWGVDQDIDAFARAIMRYLTINKRWNSPKFLFGESYGTLRSAGLVHALQSRGVQMNGVTLMSTILNYGIRQPGFDEEEIAFLPSYAATAWYHNRLPNRPATLEPFLTEVRQWAAGPYLTALAKGSDLPDAERQAIATQMSAYTGLSVRYILDSDLRVDLSRFRKELLRDQHRSVGRLDSRFLGMDADSAGEGPEYDATDTSLTGPYVTAANAYLTDTLGFRTELLYRPKWNVRSGPLGWDQSHASPAGGGRKMGLANTALDLATAMRRNPNLKVLSLNGYYDMATPFFGAEYGLKSMQIPAELRKNISYHYYESGHMIYTNPAVTNQWRKDILAFYDSALGAAR